MADSRAARRPAAALSQQEKSMLGKQKLRGLALSASLIALTGCAIPTSGIEITDTSCQSFRPIYGSRGDTDETKRQVIGHNAAWNSVCAEGQRPGREPSIPPPPQESWPRPEAEVASAGRSTT